MKDVEYIESEILSLLRRNTMLCIKMKKLMLIRHYHFVFKPSFTVAEDKRMRPIIGKNNSGAISYTLFQQKIYFLFIRSY